MTKQLLTLQEAADILGIHKQTLRRWTDTGLINCIRLPNRRDRRFLLEDIRTFISQNRNNHDN